MKKKSVPSSKTSVAADVWRLKFSSAGSRAGKESQSLVTSAATKESPAPSGRNKPAQGKKRNDAALGHASQNTSSPERGKEGGELPNGWRHTTVDESIRIIDYRGRTPPFDGTVIPHLRSQNVKSGRIVWEDLAYVSEGTYSTFMTRGIPQPGDILFTTEAPLGEVAPVPEQRFSVAQRIMVLRPTPELWSPLFLMYQLMSPEVQSRIRRKGTGSTVTGVASRNFKPLALRVAPIPEQRRIVAEIEKQFTRLEAGVAALRRVQANLKRYRAAVLKAACEGRLVPTEAELRKSEVRGQKSKAKSETGAELLARILTERRQNWQGRGQYKEPAAPDTANLPPLPEGYVWASFGQICRVQGGFAFKSTDYVKEGVPLVRISNLVNGRVQVSEDTVFLPPAFAAANPAFLLRKGDVLIAMSGATTGKMATMEDDIPALLNQRVGRFVLSSEELSNPKFVSYLVMQITQKVLKDAYGAAQPNISPAEIEEFAIPLPPLAEQTRIVAEVERRLSVVEELESVVTANLQRATRLRQSILQKAFTGELA